MAWFIYEEGCTLLFVPGADDSLLLLLMNTRTALWRETRQGLDILHSRESVLIQLCGVVRACLSALSGFSLL